MESLAIAAALVLVYGAVSRRLTSTVVTAPMLFVDAIEIELPRLVDEVQLPARMLTVGLLGTVALGTLVGLVVFDLELWEAALLAAILAPTDAALGQAVITNRDVPVRIRETLSVESGLNDGIALPLVDRVPGSGRGGGDAGRRRQRRRLRRGAARVRPAGRRSGRARRRPRNRPHGVSRLDGRAVPPAVDAGGRGVRVRHRGSRGVATASSPPSSPASRSGRRRASTARMPPTSPRTKASC